MPQLTISVSERTAARSTGQVNLGVLPLSPLSPEYRFSCHVPLHCGYLERLRILTCSKEVLERSPKVAISEVYPLSNGTVGVPPLGPRRLAKKLSLACSGACLPLDFGVRERYSISHLIRRLKQSCYLWMPEYSQSDERGRYRYEACRRDLTSRPP